MGRRGAPIHMGQQERLSEEVAVSALHNPKSKED